MLILLLILKLLPTSKYASWQKINMINVRMLYLKGGWDFKTQGQNFNSFGKEVCNYPEVYSEHCQRYKMELFAKILNGFHPLIILTKSSKIFDRVLNTFL